MEIFKYTKCYIYKNSLSEKLYNIICKEIIHNEFENVLNLQTDFDK